MADPPVAASAGRLEAAYLAERARLVALGTLLSGSPAAGEDLVQETFASLLARSRRDPDYLREPVAPLLRTVLVRLAAQRRRQLGRELRRLVRLYERPRDGDWTEGTLDYLAALATLPPRMRACVVLFYGEDMAVDQVAAHLGCSPSTVQNQLRAARQRLRARLSLDEVGAATNQREGER